MATTPTVPVPALSSKVDPEVKRAIHALIQHQNKILSGDVAVGAVASSTTGTLLSGDVYSPGAVTNLVVTSAFNTILLSWSDSQSRSLVAGYEVYRAGVDDINQAVNIGYTTAKGYADTPSDTSTSVEYFYWVRVVSRDAYGTLGAFNAVSGTSGHTANDPRYFIEMLQGQILADDLPEVVDEVYFNTPKFALINPAVAPQTVNSITLSGTTATANVTAHGFLSGENRLIAGAEQPEYNGMKLITVVDADNFTFQVAGSPASPATVAPGISAIKVSGSEASVPFIVTGGKVYIDTAMIASLTADKITTGTMNGDRIAAGTLKAGSLEATMAVISVIQSQGWASGSGWKLDGPNNTFTIGTWGDISSVAGDAPTANADKTSSQDLSGIINGQTTTINGGRITTGTAYVDTLEIKGQAVTIPSSAYTAASILINDYTTVAIQSLTFTSTGSPVIISFSVDLTVNAGSLYFAIYRGSTLVWSSTSGIHSGLLFPNGVVTDTPGAGAVTYYLKIILNGSYNQNTQCANRSMWALEVKR